MGFQVRIQRNNLQRAGAIARSAAARAVREVADEARDTARSLVPVDTGNLRGTIVVEEVDALNYELTEGGPTEESPEGADYSQFLEFGTSRMSPRPHFTPAVEEARGKLGGRVAEAVRRALGG